MTLESEQTLLIGNRLKAARTRARLTQRQLAEQLGLEHRQTLASIEAGERRLTAAELLRAVSALGVDLDFFTDSFRLVGEGRFSFRAAKGVSPNLLDAFEDRAGRWIATWRELGSQQGENRAWLSPALTLSRQSSFEEAQAAATAVVEQWQLGERPAEALQPAMERELGALVLNVDAPAGISGAASQVPGLNTVLVNRAEPEGRRNFDLAHELFHLLTWDVMPPERVEAADVPLGGKGNRVEQLAENFAAALLMPEPVMRARWEAWPSTAEMAPTRAPIGPSEMHEWLNATATDLRVSAVACKWRLFNLGWLSKADLLDIDDRQLVANGGIAKGQSEVRAFSERFVRRIAAALDEGRLSVKRAASLLGISLRDLAALLRDYGIEPSFEA